jgi:hypothetical protein
VEPPSEVAEPVSAPEPATEPALEGEEAPAA